MKVQRRAFLCALFFLSGAMFAQPRSLTKDQQERYLAPTTKPPVSAVCPDDGEVPIVAMVKVKKRGAKSEQLIISAGFWAKTRQSWLNGKKAKDVIAQAVNYVMNARISFPGLTGNRRVIVFVPCSSS